MSGTATSGTRWGQLSAPEIFVSATTSPLQTGRLVIPRLPLALSARFTEAESVLREALEEAALMRMGTFHSQMIMRLGEARFLMGAVEEASELAKDALRNTRERHEAGLEAWALRLVAEVTTRHEVLDVPENLPSGDAES